MEITHLSWGKITVCGMTFKDCIITPLGVKKWDWSEDGTRHNPGITTDAVDQLFDCEQVILTRGMETKLQVPQETIDHVKVDCHVLQTEKAVEKYNQLLNNGVKVGGLFHSTC